MLVSEVTTEFLWGYLRVSDPQTGEEALLQAAREAAASYIRNYTGVTDLDSHPEFLTAFLVLIQDFWDNRSLYVSGDANRVVASILDMHATNYL